jgi:hypothetical protein
VWSAVLTGLLTAIGPAVEEALLPWLAATLRVVDPEHRVEHLALRDTPAGRVVELTVTRQGYVFVGDRALEPNPSLTATASTLVGGVRLTLVLVLASALAHGAAGWLARGLQLLLACVAALLCLALDVPLLLAAAIEHLYLQAFDPLAGSALQAWSAFMLGGGRHAVPMVLGCLAGRLGQQPMAAPLALNGPMSR